MTPITSNNFLGLSSEQADYSCARIAILPVPYEKTVSYKGGTAKGPAAIIEASTQVELYDEELASEPFMIGVATLEPLKVQGLATPQMSERVSLAVAKIIADGKAPFIFGGEHSITPAIVKAVKSAHGDVTVVQLDAHADLRQEFEGDRLSHACAMARVREMCPAVQVGIRSLSSEEALWVKRDNLPVFFAHEMRAISKWIDDAVRKISTEKVYITIDIDAFDASIMPATGTPEPGGMSWYDVTSFIKKITEAKQVVGFDLVEFSPIPGLHACDFTAAKLAYKCIGYWARGCCRTAC